MRFAIVRPSVEGDLASARSGGSAGRRTLSPSSRPYPGGPGQSDCARVVRAEGSKMGKGPDRPAPTVTWIRRKRSMRWTGQGTWEGLHKLTPHRQAKDDDGRDVVVSKQGANVARPRVATLQAGASLGAPPVVGSPTLSRDSTRRQCEELALRWYRTSFAALSQRKRKKILWKVKGMVAE